MRRLRFFLVVTMVLVLVTAPAAPLVHLSPVATVGAATCTPFSGGIIDSSGCYELTQGTTDNATTFVVIASSDVVLDGMGYTVDGDRSEPNIQGGIEIIPESDTSSSPADTTNVTVENVTINQYETGIYVPGGTYATVKDVTVRNVAIQSSPDWGVYANTEGPPVENLHLDNVTVNGSGEGGLYYERVVGSTVEGSTFEQMSGAVGIEAVESTSITVANATFDSLGGGVDFDETGSSHVENSDFTAVDGDAVLVVDGSGGDGFPSDDNRIVNNTMTDTGGVRVAGFGSASNTSILNNTVTNGRTAGIEITGGEDFRQSVGNIVENNTIRNHVGGGIYVFRENPDSSPSAPAIVDTVLRNNTVEDNDDGTGSGRGIVLVNTGNATLRDNVISGHTIDFEIDQEYDSDPTDNFLVDNFRHDIDESNTVEGNPIVYLRNVSGTTVESTDDVGALVIVDSSDVTVRDRTLSDHGPLVVNSTDVTMENVVFGGTGLDIVESVDSIVDGAEFAPVEEHIDESGMVGGRFISTTNVTVRNATATSNADGFDARGSNGEDLHLDNVTTATSGFTTGVFLYFVNGTRITNSTIHDNNDGVYINGATNTTFDNTSVSNNTVGSNGIGVYNGGDNTTIRNSIIETSGYHGIESAGSVVGLTVVDSIIRKNGDGIAGDGIHFASNNENARIENTTVEYNEGNGIEMGSGNDGHSILDSTVAYNGQLSGLNGILVDGSNHVLRNNTIDNHSVSATSTGVVFDDASNVVVENFSMENNSYGLVLTGGQTTSVAVDNARIYGGDTGIRVEDARDNTFENLAVANQASWTFFQPDVGGTYDNNTVTNTSVGGINASFDAVEVGIAPELNPPANPSGYEDIGIFLEATNNSDVAYVDFTISYTDNDVSSVDESNLSLWHHNGSWHEVASASVDTAANEVTGNVTSFSAVAPLAETSGESGGGGGGGDTTAPAVQSYTLSVLDTKELQVSLTTDEELSAATIEIQNASGNTVLTLDVNDLGPAYNTGSGYLYGHTFTVSDAEQYTAYLRQAEDAAGNDAGTDQTRTATVYVESATVRIVSGAGDVSKIDSNVYVVGGLLQVQLRDAEDSSGTIQERTELSDVGVTNTTTFEINATIDGYEPRLLLGTGRNVSWTTTVNGNGSTNVSITADPGRLQLISSRLSGSSGAWPTGANDQADESYDAVVDMAIDEMSFVAASERDAYNGTVLATDAQEFGTPQVTATGSGNPQLRLNVAGPHLTVSGEENVGYFDAFLPNALLTQWGVTNPSNLTVAAIGESVTPAAQQSGSGIRLEFTPHYSQGDVAIEADNSDPTASATVDDAAPTVGQTVTFDGSGSADDNGVSSYSWDFGDGTTGSGTSPTHSYATTGTYTATLTVTDDAGNTDTDTVSVTVSSSGSTSPTSSSNDSSGSDDSDDSDASNGGGGGSGGAANKYETSANGNLRDGRVSVGLPGGTGLNGIDIEMSADGRVSVQEYSRLPAELPTPPGRFVAGMDISAPDPDSGTATVRVRISSTLVGAFNADPADLRIRHYDAAAGTWETLETRLVSTAGEVVLEAETDGFSPFAVTIAEPSDSTVTPTATPEPTATDTPTPQSDDRDAGTTDTPTATTTEVETTSEGAGPGFGAVVAAIAILAAVLLAVRGRRE